MKEAQARKRTTAEWLGLMARMKLTQLQVQTRVNAGQPQHPTDKSIGTRIHALARGCALLRGPAPSGRGRSTDER